MPQETIYETLMQISQQVGALTAKVDAFITRSDDGDAILRGRLDDLESRCDEIDDRLRLVEQKPATVAKDIVLCVLRYAGTLVLGAVGATLIHFGGVQ